MKAAGVLALLAQRLMNTALHCTALHCTALHCLGVPSFTCVLRLDSSADLALEWATTGQAREPGMSRHTPLLTGGGEGGGLGTWDMSVGGGGAC